MGNGGCKYICYFSRLFYYTIVDFEVTDGSRVSFPTDAPNHLPDLFHGSLTSHLRMKINIENGEFRGTQFQSERRHFKGLELLIGRRVDNVGGFAHKKCSTTSNQGRPSHRGNDARCIIEISGGGGNKNVRAALNSRNAMMHKQDARYDHCCFTSVCIHTQLQLVDVIIYAVSVNIARRYKVVVFITSKLSKQIWVRYSEGPLFRNEDKSGFGWGAMLIPQLPQLPQFRNSGPSE